LKEIINKRSIFGKSFAMNVLYGSVASVNNKSKYRLN